jgi:hypothetical protein
MTGFAFWVIPGNEINQIRPKHHLFHQLKGHLFARLLDVQDEGQSGLFQATWFETKGMMVG